MRTAGIIRIIVGLVIAVFLTAILVAALTGSNIIKNFGWNGSWIDRIVERSTYTYGGVNGDTNEIIVSDEARVDASTIRSIDIGWVSGNVNISIGSDDQIVFSESSYRSLTDQQKMRYSVSSNGTLQIRFRDDMENIFDWFSVDANMPSKDLTVEVPASLIGLLTDVEIDTVSADIDLSGVYGEKTEVSSVSGEIRCSNIVSDDFDVSSTSGSVICENCAADTLKINNVSGSTRAEGEFDEIKVEVVSGSVRLACANVPSKINVDGVSGSVTIALPENAEFTAKLDSVSGSISCAFPGTLGDDLVVVGNGNASYRVNTVSGSLKIEKN